MAYYDIVGLTFAQDILEIHVVSLHSDRSGEPIVKIEPDDSSIVKDMKRILADMPGAARLTATEESTHYIVRFEEVCQFRLSSEYWQMTVTDNDTAPYEQISDFAWRLTDTDFFSEYLKVDLGFEYALKSDKDVAHYQVCGDNYCVDVVSGKPPTIEVK